MHCKFTSEAPTYLNIEDNNTVHLLHLFHQDKSSKHQQKLNEALHGYSIHHKLLVLQLIQNEEPLLIEIALT
jgi:hypothetical protein